MGMSSQTDQVTRRMQALLDLLKAAATDDNAFLNKEAERCRSDLGELPAELPEAPQEWDTTIEKLTKQLEESLKDTPERDEIEEVQPARATYKPRSAARRPPRQASAVNDAPKRPESPKRAKKTVEPPPEEKEEVFDHRSQLERESSGLSYPKIGPGYSDSISVVSDLSTPTVVTHLYVPEEEHYGPPLQIGFRQPSVGSNQMATAPPEHDSSRHLQERKPQPPSQRVVTRRPGGAAAHRLQHHQAVLAHLRESETTDVQNRKKSAPAQTPAQSVSDLTSLNYPTDEPSVYAAMLKPVNNGKRSLLRKSNKYAASVTATSTRMLLHSNQKKQNIKRYGLQRNKKETAESPVPPPNKVDVDGVLSTMNCDIDFIFQELSVLEDEPFARAMDDGTDSNIGATAKIKYNLKSVARTLRNHPPKPDSLKNQDALLDNQKDAWGALTEEPPSIKSDPLLIDEDGFIVSNDSGFVDPFAPNKQEDLFASQKVDPFANTFFSAAKEDAVPKRKMKRRSSRELSTMVEPSNTMSSSDSKDSRIDAVEMATKKRIEMLRKLVEYRARTSSEDPKQGGSKEELQKLDFVEAETMKQITRLRDRLGESRRQFGDV